ncbi:MAG: hypothetical protein K8F53_11300 [Rhodocyclaceae bacterium]|nr:hypothetical protein [Rhodocyclaceae bacterium]
MARHPGSAVPRVSYHLDALRVH